MSTQKQQVAMDGKGRARVRLRRPPRPGGKLKPERVQLELKTMPGWRLVAGGNALARTRKFTQPGAAAKWAGFIADLTATERHAVTLGVTASQVTLLLQRPSRKGINMPLLDFARQLG
jgi:pterin-4a-carbinolamine dehydratase